MTGKIFLTALGFYNPKVKEKFETLVGEKKDKNVAIITTAATDKENNKYAKIDKDTFSAMGFNSVDFVDLETEPKKDLSKYDVMHVLGGNSFKLLKFAKEAEFNKSIDQLLSRGGIYIGLSAGSVIMSPSIQLAQEFEPERNTEIGLTDFSGLNITPYTIFPHYTEDLEERIKAFEQKHGVKIYRLRNEDAIIHDAIPTSLELVA